MAVSGIDVFYAWWSPVFIALLLGSVVFNYHVGLCIIDKITREGSARAMRILQFGVVADLALLGYYKYANFFVQNVDSLINIGWHIETVVLPVGISFFTFTQIAFLVDAYRGEVKDVNFVHYGLFVTYFPHLIAGPVLHHKEMMPQFSDSITYKLNWESISIGLTMFAIGLFKKVVIADGVAPFASQVFSIAAGGGELTFVEAWAGALAYTFQLYFDFSAYSDMAIGLSRLFGVKLPLNFNSPYKSINIIDFWRRWHITLSRFLRDYLYVPLGGNRKGTARRYLNLMLTMILGGLWHGAGWTFLIWGTLHGLYLVVNQGWRQLRSALGQDLERSSVMGRSVSLLVTFLVVVIGWVFFRAESIDAAYRILRGMAGANGLTLPVRLLPGHLETLLGGWGVNFGHLSAISHPGGLSGMAVWLTVLLAVVWFSPNSQQIMAKYRPAIEVVTTTSRVLWQPNMRWMMVTAAVLLYAFTEIGKISEFLYFQF